MLGKDIKVKVCSCCGGIKLANDFYKNDYNEDGLDSYCKFCRREYQTEWNDNHPIARYLIQWRYRNKQKEINGKGEK